MIFLECTLWCHQTCLKESHRPVRFDYQRMGVPRNWWWFVDDVCITTTFFSTQGVFPFHYFALHDLVVMFFDGLSKTLMLLIAWQSCQTLRRRTRSKNDLPPCRQTWCSTFFHSLSCFFLPFDPLDQLQMCPRCAFVNVYARAVLGAATWNMGSGIVDFTHSLLDSKQSHPFAWSTPFLFHHFYFTTGTGPSIFSNRSDRHLVPALNYMLLSENG